MANKRLARQLSTTITTVLLWRRRFEQEGLPGILHDRPRAGRPRQISLEKEAAIVEATHWTVRTMARSQGVSPATVQRIWRAYRLQPHRLQAHFRLSTDQSAITRTAGD
jgi:homeodomain-containing protein